MNMKSSDLFDDMNPESSACLKIKPSEAPQWTWSTIECRMWLLRLLRDYMDLEPDVAVRYALKFDGQGSTLLRQPVETWMADFGDYVGGIIYNTIMEFHESE
jgi:hypothetical protein